MEQDAGGIAICVSIKNALEGIGKPRVFFLFIFSSASGTPGTSFWNLGRCIPF
jgi:hypothetical protein